MFDCRFIVMMMMGVMCVWLKVIYRPPAVYSVYQLTSSKSHYYIVIIARVSINFLNSILSIINIKKERHTNNVNYVGFTGARRVNGLYICKSQMTIDTHSQGMKSIFMDDDWRLVKDIIEFFHFKISRYIIERILFLGF
jgi:hypothetical protein